MLRIVRLSKVIIVHTIQSRARSAISLNNNIAACGFRISPSCFDSLRFISQGSKGSRERNSGMGDVEMMDESELPSAAECQQRCETFAAVTGTDTALAMMFLQNTCWEVESAINAFYDEVRNPQSPMRSVLTGAEPRGGGAGDNFSFTFPDSAEESSRVRIMSWNLDGLDAKGLSGRTEFAASCLREIKPHVLLLQEVVAESETVLRRELRNDYEFVGDANHGDYYCLVLLHKKFVVKESATGELFDNSVMGRALITVQATVKGLPCLIMTSHLESTKDFSEPRVAQLKHAWNRMAGADNRSAIFGGDMNLRDSEIARLNGLPPRVEDVWESCGKRQEARFTWDPRRNTNAGMQFGGPGCRFDRMYLKRALSGKSLKPVYFELSGIEKLPRSSNRFISDHWAILAHFDIE